MISWLRRLFRTRSQNDLERQLEEWRIVSAVNAEKGEAAIFRLRIRRPPTENIADFKFAVYVTWPYESSSVMPEAQTQEEQKRFDIALDEITGDNGYSELVRVSTGNGLKEWLFYTTDVQKFGESFNRVLQGHPKYPVAVKFEEDPAWSAWSEFVEAVGTRTEI